MTPRLICLLALLATSAKAETPSADSGQRLWQFLRAHGYGALPIESQRNNTQYVEATINGHGVELAIDTGANLTCLRRECAKHLRLEIHETRNTITGVGGKAEGTAGLALISSFKLMGYEINRTNIITVLPGIMPAKDADGLLGYDFLRLNAVIIPVGAKFVFFKPGNAPVPDARAFMTALGFRPVPLQHDHMGLIVAGKMNGVPLSAVVDCGASYTDFSAGFLTQSANVTTHYIGRMAVGLDRTLQPTYTFTPRSLSFGDVNLQPEQLLAQLSPSLLLGHHDAFLGYDLLAEHEAMIDMGNGVLWLK